MAVNFIAGLGGFKNQHRSKGDGHPPHLIAAIIDEDEQRIGNLLPQETSDPTEEYAGQNAYEHASSVQRKKKIDLQMIIAQLSLSQGIQLSRTLLELHRQAVKTAKERFDQGKGSGVYNDPKGADFRSRYNASKESLKDGPGIIV